MPQRVEIPIETANEGDNLSDSLIGDEDFVPTKVNVSRGLPDHTKKKPSPLTHFNVAEDDLDLPGINPTPDDFRRRIIRVRYRDENGDYRIGMLDYDRDSEKDDAKNKTYFWLITEEGEEYQCNQKNIELFSCDDGETNSQN